MTPSDRPNTLAGAQQGAARLAGPLLGLALVALPISWHLPLFHTELLVFLENDVTLTGAVMALWETDLFLCAVVVAFGMLIPFVKLAGLLHAWFALPKSEAARRIGLISKLSKFAMLDVLLIALVVVGLKGVGMGKVSVDYGLYVYAGVVLAVLALSSWIEAAARPAAAQS